MNTTDPINNLSSWELLAILDSIDDAVFIDDSDGIAIWCNEACQELYKVTPEDVVGQHVLELEKRGIFSPSVANRVLKEKREVTIIHENKEGKKLLSTGTPLIDENGKIIRIITTSRDITELTNMQNQLQAVQGTLEGIKSLEKVANQEIIVASHAMFNVMQLAKRLATVDSQPF